MLTLTEYENLWKTHFSGIVPAGVIMPDYCEYLNREHMVEDYLDIFRGINTRASRAIQPCHGWYYPHPFFDEKGKGKIEKPCIKYIMIGEGIPTMNIPNFNMCGGDNKNTYFYNTTHLGSTVWLREPFKAFNAGISWVSPLCPSDKINILLNLAKNGYFLFDLFPFAIKLSTRIRQLLINTGIVDVFWAYSVNRINILNHLFCNGNELKTIIAFSGPKKIHHYLSHQIANTILPLPLGCSINAIPNFVVAPVPIIPVILPLDNSPWLPAMNLLNGIYPNLVFVNFPFYRCCCFNTKVGSLHGPHELFIRNAFNLP
jgi:hypothetical protein